MRNEAISCECFLAFCSPVASIDFMKYCEFGDCDREATRTLKLSRLETFYCDEHFTRVKRRLSGS